MSPNMGNLLKEGQNMKNQFSTRLLSLLLTLTMVFGLLVPVSAAGSDSTELKFEKVDEAVDSKLPQSKLDGTEEAYDIANGEYKYADDEKVRVSIVLDGETTIEKFGSEDIASNSAAVAYRDELKSEQADVTKAIEAKLGLENGLDVKWNLTLAANIISANVLYEQIEDIEKVSGVKKVVIETKYEPMVVDKEETADPNMATSTIQTGATNAWAEGYTGAGSKVAVIDTGIDYKHQSFTAAAWEHSIEELAAAAHMRVDKYKESIGVLEKADLTDEVLRQLNVEVTADEAYLNSKIPFAYNYIDKNYTVDHIHDSQGEHGSHVEGIAAANKYIQNDDGTFTAALDSVMVQGVAPDAQIVTMKVFGAGGGAYDSDYMAAIEDAVVLGCDSVNLSLGSGNPGFSRNSKAEYQSILDNLTKSGTVVSMSAGNSSSWADSSANGVGLVYDDEINFQTGGSPGSYTNSLTVASINNAGSTGHFFTVGDTNVFYTETSYKNAPLTTLAGDRDYVILAPGTSGNAEDYESIDVKDKVVFVQRGGISFVEKGENAVNAGAIATVIYNNAAGTINMDLSTYTKAAPCVSITQADGLAIWKASTKSEGDKYATGKMNVKDTLGSAPSSEPAQMSDFSSWGVPGSLELKPEITAPGGSIYSVNGAHKGDGAHESHDIYETMSGTSMASPQVAGMAAVLGQYIRENNLTEKTGLTQRQLINSLLMSTATPVIDPASGEYYAVMNQGAGLANVGNAVNAQSYVLVKENLSGTASDGKVKAELGDDPDKTGDYTVDFSVTNFSDEDTEYTFSADMFTQDMYNDKKYTYLDTNTTPLEATTTFTVGDTTVDKVTVKAGDTVEVTVNIVLSDAQKAKLNKDYPVGAYVEGFVFAKPENTSDDAALPAHSIPVLGFYGNWSDATMLDTSTLVEWYYGDKRTRHTGVAQTNYSTTKYPGESTEYIYTVNPYLLEGNTVEDIPYDRAAINSATTLSKYTVTMERNAAAAVYFVKNAAGEVVYTGSVTEQVASAYYYVNGSAWRNTSTSITANQKLASLGFKEGDKVTAGVAFIPEYYEGDGTLTKDQAAALIKSGKLGEGAYFANTYTVDDTAPEITGVYKNLDGSGSVLISAKDNQYIAYLAVYRGVGSKVIAEGVPHQTNPGESTTVRIDFDSDPGEYIKIVVADYAGNETTYKAYYGGEPEDYSGRMFGFTSGTKRGNGQRWVEVDVDTLSDKTGLSDVEEVNYEVYAAEYVGKYVFFATLDGIYAAPQEEYSNVSKVTSFSGVFADKEQVADMAFNVEDGKLYVLTNTVSALGSYTIATQGNKLYAVDYVNGEIEKVADITISHSNDSYRTLRTLAIDNGGTFYAVNTGSGTNVYLYKWTLDTIKNGVISNLKPASSTMRECDLNNDGKTNADDAQIILDYVSGAIETIDVKVADYDGDGKVTSYDAYLVLTAKDNSISLYGSGMWLTSFASMAYDHDDEILYLAAGYGAKSSADKDNELWVINTETCKADHPNSNNAQFYDHVVGLYVVPKDTVSLPKNVAVTKVEINKTELTVLKGSTLTLEAAVYPWLAADKSVTWTTSDAETVSVDQNGEIKALNAGKATITATSVADPTKSAKCVVTVEKLDNIKVSGLVYGNDSKAYWSEFNTDKTEAWTKANENAAGNYVAGTLHEGQIIVHDGSNVSLIDPDTFEVTPYGQVPSIATWSDAAESPAKDGLFGKMLALCNDGTWLVFVDPSISYGQWSLFNLSTNGFSEDPLATIAYISSGTYDYNYLWYSFPDCPANFYYAMTESGELYKFTVFTKDDGESYSMVMEDLGSTGLELTGVSAVTAGQYASMVYDEATGYLLVSRCLDSETATLFAINPTADELVSAEVGTFGDKVGPVVSLYQYDRPTDLTIKANTAPVTMYVGDTYKVTAKVILGETNELTWKTSAPAVATVENGVITAVGEGTATITMTTVDTNKNGEHVSKTIDVTVKGLVDVNATVKAQATINGTTAWIAIDLNDMSTTKLGNAATEFYGAGYSAGALWGTDIKDADGHIYKIDANTFAESQGSECNASYAIRDVAENPEVQFTLTEADGTVHPATTFGDPLYISNSDGLYELVDYAAGSLSGWRASSSYTDLAAISYVGDTTVEVVNTMLPASDQITEADADTTCHVYYVVSIDGSVYQFITVPIWDVTADEGEEVSAILVRGLMGELGMTFSDTMALSAEYVEFADDNYGLLIADATDGSIYYANLAGEEEITCGKVGKIDGATNIAGLYNAAASNGTTNVKVVASAVVADSVEQAVETSTVPADVAVMSAMNDKEAAAYTADVVEATATVSMSTPLTTSKVNGSLNAVAPQSVKGSKAEADNHEITVLLTEDVAVTNGKYTITYDPAKVTFKNVESTLPYKSFNVDETNGVIVFAFARATAVPAGVTLAAVKFEYGDYVNSDITITVDERGADTSVDEEDPVVIPVEDEIGEHEWVETKRVEPTCTEDGYIEYTCTKCATTKRTVLKALGHDIKHEAAYESYRVEPTCTEDGYIVYKCTRCEETKTEVLKALGHNFVVEEGYAGLTRNKLVCSRCGLVISGDSPIPVLNPKTSPILNPTKPTTPVVEPKEDDEDEEPVVEEPADVSAVDPVKSELPFTDVTPEDWFYTAVEYLYNEGIMNGTSETEFSPEYELNRATVVTILYRLEGEPAVETADTFSDVEEGEWYTAAVEWAASVGIVKGYEDGTFAPKKAVTREQLAAIIYRYAEFKGITIAETTAELGEEAVVSDWAKENVEWAVSEGLLVEGENVNATENANRAEVAAMIYTFLTKTSK